MIVAIREGIVDAIFRTKAKPLQEEVTVFESPKNFIHSQYTPLDKDKNKNDKEPLANSPKPSAVKVGRNEPCPCGSGKKYKRCCGK